MKEENKACGECEKQILDGEPVAVHDGEVCHLNCAAEAMDEDDFDNWFLNN